MTGISTDTEVLESFCFSSMPIMCVLALGGTNNLFILLQKLLASYRNQTVICIH